MLCRLTGWGTSFPLSAEDYVYPETGTDRPNLPIVATTFARNIVLINSISSFENISFLHRYIRAYIDPFHCSIASQSFYLPVDIATIELTISFCTPGFGKLSNTLMPLSSLAAGPARITIPNEPVARATFSNLSLCLSSLLLEFVLVPPTFPSRSSDTHDVAGRQSPFPRRGPWKPNKNKQICLYRKCRSAKGPLSGARRPRILVNSDLQF